MKATLLTPLRQPLEVTTVPIRDPGPGQVRTRASVIGGTDEPAGVIETVGPGGDR